MIKTQLYLSTSNVNINYRKSSSRRCDAIVSLKIKGEGRERGYLAQVYTVSCLEEKNLATNINVMFSFLSQVLVLWTANSEGW